jgi:hypothetical protein
MGKRGVMDVWAALQWVVQDQKADMAYNDGNLLGYGEQPGSITRRVMNMAQYGAVIGGSDGSMPDLDPDAEIIWIGVECLFEAWRTGALVGEVGLNVPVQMQRCLKKWRRNPVAEMVLSARSGVMPDWMPGGWQNDSGLTRREVEECRLNYIMVWDMLAALCMRLQGSHRLGIVVEMPGIPRLPWHGRKKVQQAS